MTSTLKEDDQPTYAYPPLSGTDQIRVLEILPTKKRIECRIRHTTFFEGAYHALSYVWGDPETKHQAMVIDESGALLGGLPLTQNLVNALQAIRESSLGHKSFWIDQICINQQDATEKNHQVALMGKIYSHAEKVITYMGPMRSEEEQEHGRSLLERLKELFPSEHNAFKTLHSSGSFLETDKILRRDTTLTHLPRDLEIQEEWTNQEELHNYINQGWRWLLEVGLGDWTQRLWIVQEQMLNTEGYFMQGILPVRYLKRFADERNLDISSPTSSLLHMWRTRLNARTGVGQSPSFPLLSTNLSLTYGLQCRDPRDRVYALLAISSDVDLDATTPLIQPDYSDATTLAVLSKRLTLAWLKREDLYHTAVFHAVILLACKWRQPSALPSWCINLDLPYSTMTPRTINSGRWFPHPKTHIDTCLFSLHDDDAVLVFKGRVLDYISEASRIFEPAKNKLIDRRYTLKYYNDILGMMSSEITMEKIAMLCRTLAPDDWRLPKHAELSEEAHVAIYLYYYFIYLVQFLNEGGTTSEPETLTTLDAECNRTIATLSRLFPPEYHYSAREQLQDKIFDASLKFHSPQLFRGRCFCVSRTGKFCNVSNQAQEGDAVVVSRGSHCLYIMRPVGDERYQLVGDAYVDGLMHGEAYSGLDPDSVDYDIALV
ncbi:hypothetical protein N0V90_005517 [Kalmusia sp. IMI 367209]|nr:hypothetical protein N0V90_005517 [Kalmusia sp. IMI 367209]